MREKPFENKIKEYITKHNGWCVKFFANGYTKRGIPDVLACVNGRFLAVEVKGDGGEPTALQLRNLRVINEAQGFGVVVYPDEFDSFCELVDDLNRSNG